MSLADYRRRVQDIYGELRANDAGEACWHQWRTRRDLLFRSHVQSPIVDSERPSFEGLQYFAYDPSMRFDAVLEPAVRTNLDIAHSGSGATRFVAIGEISLVPIGISESLTVFWLDAYGGGIFVPFRDATSGVSSYGGGRYLLDTVKGADLGGTEGRLNVDFNYAYHPSCVYSSRWSCPLAPPSNWLDAAIEAGEMLVATEKIESHD